mmetsp:Transcript_126121/g.403591  ORF Transcript_126121/g.403591 Transcript_126121/m.403591 type:complete len:207 (+) Transcript_126121:1429-2049(+)
MALGFLHGTHAAILHALTAAVESLCAARQCSLRLGLRHLRCSQHPAALDEALGLVLECAALLQPGFERPSRLLLLEVRLGHHCDRRCQRASHELRVFVLFACPRRDKLRLQGSQFPLLDSHLLGEARQKRLAQASELLLQLAEHTHVYTNRVLLLLGFLGLSAAEPADLAGPRAAPAEALRVVLQLRELCPEPAGHRRQGLHARGR